MTRKTNPSDKLYLKIGEAASAVGVKPYVLRYWESEFSALRPTKTKSKHRLYRQRDVETLREIKRLLYEERLTIEGAKKRLASHGKKAPRETPSRAPDPKVRTVLTHLKKDIESLLRVLR